MKKLFLFLTIFFVFTITVTPSVFAQGLTNAGGIVSGVASDVGFTQESGDIGTFTGTIIQAVLSLTGTVFLALTVYGGFLWMTDRGNSDQVERAKKMITAAAIGLFITLSAFAITQLVVARFNSPQTAQQVAQ